MYAAYSRDFRNQLWWQHASFLCMLKTTSTLSQQPARRRQEGLAKSTIKRIENKSSS